MTGDDGHDVDYQTSSQESNGSTKSYASTDDDAKGGEGLSGSQELPDTQPMDDAGAAGENWKGGLAGQTLSTPWAMLVSQSKHFDNVSITTDKFSCGKDRSSNCIIIEDRVGEDCFPQFSRTQFKIERVREPGVKNYDIYLTDCSFNGTYINKEKVGKGKKRALRNKDTISITHAERDAFCFILIQDDTDDMDSSQGWESPNPNSLPPDLLAEYVVSNLLGKGACGSAYLAYAKDNFDENQNPRKFCVKVIYRDRSLPVPPVSSAAAAAAAAAANAASQYSSSSRGTLDSRSAAAGKGLGSDGTGEVSPDSFRGVPLRPRQQSEGASSRLNTSSIFKPEIDILNHLKDRSKGHPNIIGYEGTFQSASSIAIVFELAKGGELFDYIIDDFNNNSFKEKNAKIQFYQILSGIKYLHDNDVCHRDLKLENILCAEPNKLGLIKITDFGLSKLLVNNAPMTTYVGTPSYIAPEVIANSTEIDPRKHSPYTVKADMWSLGCILFSLICGSPAFHSANNDDNELRQLIMAGEYCICEETNPIWKDISDEGKDLLRQLLQVNPKKRLSAGEALEHPWFDEDTVEECTAIMNTGRRGYFYKKGRKDPSDVRNLLGSMELLEGEDESETESGAESEDEFKAAFKDEFKAPFKAESKAESEESEDDENQVTPPQRTYEDKGKNMTTKDFTPGKRPHPDEESSTEPTMPRRQKRTLLN